MTDHKIKAKVLLITMSYVANFCSVSPIAEKSRTSGLRAPATILFLPDRFPSKEDSLVQESSCQPIFFIT